MFSRPEYEKGMVFSSKMQKKTFASLQAAMIFSGKFGVFQNFFVLFRQKEGKGGFCTEGPPIQLKVWVGVWGSGILGVCGKN